MVWGELVTEVLSDAISLYLGRGMSPYPQRDPQRLVDLYGPEQAAVLVAQCDALLEELYVSEPDWATEDLPAATARAGAPVTASHPGLSDDALESLAWSHGWDWK